MNAVPRDLAIRWIGRDRADLDDPLDLSAPMVEARTNRFAMALAHQGYGPGTVVASLLGRVPDVYLAVLGTWAAQAVFLPLDVREEPARLAEQLQRAGARVIVSSPTLVRRSLSAVLHELPDVGLVLVCGASEDGSARSAIRSRTGPEVMSFGAFLSRESAEIRLAPPDPDRPAELFFARNGTEAPVERTHGEAAAWRRRIGRQLDLHDGDTLWCTGDPGHPSPTADELVVTLTQGVISVVDEADTDIDRWLHILRRQHVDVLCTSTAALRHIRRSAGAAPLDRRLVLRGVATIDEALDPETERWAQDFFDAPILDVAERASVVSVG